MENSEFNGCNIGNDLQKIIKGKKLIIKRFLRLHPLLVKNKLFTLETGFESYENYEELYSTIPFPTAMIQKM